MLASTLIREARRVGLPYTFTATGSLRRFAPEVGDVSLLVVDMPGRGTEPIAEFSRLPSVTGVLGWRDSSVTVLTGRGQVTLHVTVPDQAGAALVWHTGPQAHTRQLQERATTRGLSFQAGRLLDGGGLDVAVPTEDEFYRTLGLPYIPPELRDSSDAIDIAERGALPELLTELHIRGDLHMHTTWSDGRDSIEEMVLTAQQLGYTYVAITDHSERALSSRRLMTADLEQQAREIEAARQRISGIDVLWGVEAEILPDGSLDFPDDVLSRFDIVLASLHDPAGHEPQQLLDRYLTAMANPFVSVITHPANRSPGASAGYALEFDRLFAGAAATGTALEIDGGPGHLDMDGELARGAVTAGATVVVDSDCHRKDALARQMRFGVGTARRGWVEPRHVLNARDVTAVRDFIARKRDGR